MNKKWKIFWIVSAVIAGVGIILFVLGIVLGAPLREIAMQFSDEEEFHSYENGISRDIAEDGTGQMFDGVRSLSVDVDKMEVNIVPTEDDKIYVEAEGIDDRLHFRVEQDGDELDIDTEDGNRHINYGGTVNIYIPVGMELAEADISVGAGEADLSGLNAREINIECGMGSVDLSVAGAKEDYNYDIECGMGSVEIGEESYGGVAIKKKIHNGQSKNISIECGMGEVSVDFE